MQDHTGTFRSEEIKDFTYGSPMEEPRNKVNDTY